MSYFVLVSDEDGTSIEQVSMDELFKRITPNDDGETFYGRNLQFLNTVPEQDKGAWLLPRLEKYQTPILVIKGETVIPYVG